MRIIVGLFTACTMLLACNNNKEDNKPVVIDTIQQVTDPVTTVTFDSLRAHASAIIAETKSDTLVSGSAVFDTIPGGKVKIVLELVVPTRAGKSVAVHIHEHGDCSDKAEMAHGHWNPGNTEHGKWGSASFHAGDIGNIKLDAKGKGRFILETDRWTLGGNSSTNILKRAIIVHSGTDDYKTQPSGNSGSRIGCGVIQ